MTTSTEGADLRGYRSPPALGRPSAVTGVAGRLRSGGEAGGADYRADGGDSALFCLRAASVAGGRHRLDGRGGQDCYAWSLLGDTAPPGRAISETVVVAVADGVSATRRAAQAAAAAVDSACDAVARMIAEVPEGKFPPQWWSKVIDEVNRRLGDLAAEGDESLASTLVVLIARADADQEGMQVALAQVGDSCAMVLEAGGWTEVPERGPDDDELAGTSTDALPSRAPVIRTGTRTLGSSAAIALFTDGVANPLRDGPSTVAPAFAETLARPPTPLELLNLTDFSRHGCHDDRTVVALWRRRGDANASTPMETSGGGPPRS